ncbi:uncharacterized protein LOC130367489 [Hyla sarda]|uniref:uncharacterized protein LOC130367489 n=1 Tax=Hyla sarda TaxID=327740 RepID=UPI0024C3F848|nr:uncharacterized protein LOC130367489 [Hyla sarda]
MSTLPRRGRKKKLGQDLQPSLTKDRALCPHTVQGHLRHSWAPALWRKDDSARLFWRSLCRTETTGAVHGRNSNITRRLRRHSGLGLRSSISILPKFTYLTNVRRRGALHEAAPSSISGEGTSTSETSDFPKACGNRASRSSACQRSLYGIYHQPPWTSSDTVPYHESHYEPFLSAGAGINNSLVNESFHAHPVCAKRLVDHAVVYTCLK